LNMGTVGGGAMHNTASPVAISGNNLFHKSSRSVIFAFEGSAGKESDTTKSGRRDSGR
jgi:hypothetical protein